MEDALAGRVGHIQAFRRVVSADAGKDLHASLWWIHTVFALGWIAMIPYTKFVQPAFASDQHLLFEAEKARGVLQLAEY